MSNSHNWFKPVPTERRRTLTASQRSGTLIQSGGRQLINFASNDYLGLSTHPSVCHAAMDEIEKHGLGSGASRLITGDDPLLHQLESELARWKGYEACVVVGSGMLANIGLLQALAGRHTHLFCDKLNHASLVDGARLSDAKTSRFNHLDTMRLEQLLEKNPAQQRIIVSDGIFSMDGDAADLATLIRLSEEHDTLLLIDDAHGAGVVGESGKGLTNMASAAGHDRLIEVGTLGKAFGCYGAFILGTSEMIEGLRQRMRTLIYSTALPAALPAAALTALHLIQQGELVHRLHHNLELFKQESCDLPIMASDTPIQPVIIGSETDALNSASKLKEAGLFVPAIRPPTVPEGTSRLRITLSAGHSEAQIMQLIDAVRRLL